MGRVWKTEMHGFLLTVNNKFTLFQSQLKVSMVKKICNINGPICKAHQREEKAQASLGRLTRAFTACIHRKMNVEESSGQTLDLLLDRIHKHGLLLEAFVHI